MRERTVARENSGKTCRLIAVSRPCFIDAVSALERSVPGFVLVGVLLSADAPEQG